MKVTVRELNAAISCYEKIRAEGGYCDQTVLAELKELLDSALRSKLQVVEVEDSVFWRKLKQAAWHYDEYVKEKGERA